MPWVALCLGVLAIVVFIQDNQKHSESRSNYYSDNLLSRTGLLNANHVDFWSSMESHQEFGFSVLNDICGRSDLKNLVSCFAVTQRIELLSQIRDQLIQFNVVSCSKEGNRNNSWLLALYLDLLSDHFNSLLTEFPETLIKLEESLLHCLSLLEGNELSLWHGRFSIASETYLLAVFLAKFRGQKELLHQAEQHFKKNVAAIRLTEGWPEGYNYWINNRALTFLLAVSLHLKLNGDIHTKQDLKQLVHRIGLWHVYMTRPDNRISPIGDEGPRVDLKYETRKVIDLIAKITDKEIFRIYARYLTTLHKEEAYHENYRWLIPFIFDAQPHTQNSAQQNTLKEAAAGLPDVELFGKEAYNQVVIRDGWDENGIFFQLRASQQFTHHQHSDAGHFTVFNRFPVFVDGSVYDSFRSQNRRLYSGQTVSKNSILIRPNCDWSILRILRNGNPSGNQRAVFDGGSSITSIDHWRQNLEKGLFLKFSELMSNSQGREGAPVKISANITKAYDLCRDGEGSKGIDQKVVRQFEYQKAQKTLRITDDIRAFGRSSNITFLFHTLESPIFSEKDNTRAKIYRNGEVLAEIRFLSSQPLSIQVVGGDGKQFLIPDPEGHGFLNIPAESPTRPWFDNPKWQLQVNMQSSGDSSIKLVSEIKLYTRDD